MLNKKNKIISSVALVAMLASNTLGVTSLAATATGNTDTNSVGIFYDLLPSGKAAVPYVLTNKDDKVTFADVAREYDMDLFNGTSVPGNDYVVGTGDYFTKGSVDYRIVVYGDASGDGKISITDSAMIKDSILGRYTFEEWEEEAADVLNDGRISISDASRIEDYVLGRLSPVINTVPQTVNSNVADVTINPAGTAITVKFSGKTEGVAFDLKQGNDTTIVNASTSDKITYTISGISLEAGKVAVLRVLQGSDVLATEQLTYRALKGVDSNFSLTAKTNVNAEDTINAYNVNAANIHGEFSVANTVAGTVVVTLTDTLKPAEGNIPEQPAITKTLKVNIGKDVQRFDLTNVDLSELKDGEVTMKAVFTDNEGNYSVESSPVTIDKGVSPVVIEGLTATRNASDSPINNELTITGIQADIARYTYKVVAADAAAPTVEDVLENGTEYVPETTTVTVADGKAYKIYFATVNPEGTKSTELAVATIAKYGATQLLPVTSPKFDEDTAVVTFKDRRNIEEEGLVKYTVELKRDETVVDTRTINIGEELKVNFFSKVKEAAGDYTVDITAVADGVDYSNSIVVTAPETVTTTELSSVKSVVNVNGSTISLALVDGIAKWSSVELDDTKNFVVTLKKEDATLNTVDKYVPVATKTVGTDHEGDYITADFTAETRSEGNYNVEVVAVAKEDTLRVNSPVATLDQPVLVVADPTVTFKTVEITDTTATFEKTTVDKDNETLTIQIRDPKTGTFYDATGDAQGSHAVGAYAEVDGTKTTLKIKGLTPGTEYRVRLVDVYNGKTYTSSEKKITTETLRLAAGDYTVGSNIVMDAETGKVEKITYGDGKEYNTSARSYAEVVALAEMFNTNTVITLNSNGEVTAVTMANAFDTAKTLDLTGKLPAKATLTLVGNADLEKVLTVKGHVASIVLNGTTATDDNGTTTTDDDNTIAPQFDLVGLTVDAPITVSNEVSINGIRVARYHGADYYSAAPTVKSTANGLEVVGELDKWIMFDATFAGKDVTLTFEYPTSNEVDVKGGTNGHQLTIVGVTDESENDLANLWVNGGKVNVTDRNISKICVYGLRSELVLNGTKTQTKTETLTATAEEATEETTTVKDLPYTFRAVTSDAEVSGYANSNVITVEIAGESAWVVITPVAE